MNQADVLPYRIIIYGRKLEEGEIKPQDFELLIDPKELIIK